MDLSMLPDFIVEAVEHLEEMENSLLQLEQDQENKDILNEIFRSIHSIKGAAQYIGLEKVSALSHKLESLLDLIRQGEKPLNQNTIDLFIATKDRINSLVDELNRTQIEQTEIDDLLQGINEALGEPAEDQLESESQSESENMTEPIGEGPTRLENETLAEEYDEELLDIFMKQFKENIGFLQSQVAVLDSAVDKEGALDRCNDTIKCLHSSANYMGYDMLCGHYKAWQSEIDAAEQGLSSGKVVGLEFMKTFLHEILRAYPQMATNNDQKQTKEEAVPIPKDDFHAEPDQNNLDDTLDNLFGDSTAESAAHDHGYPNFVDETPGGGGGDMIAALSGDFEESSIEELGSHVNPAEEDPEEDDEGLVAALSDAFEESIAQEPGNVNTTDEEMAETSVDLEAALSEAFDATTDTTASTRAPSPLANETLDEDYDEKLLTIFMKQLVENIGFLRTQLAGFDTSPDKKAVLNRCRDAIKSLNFSAKYMGYDMLCEHYKAWQGEIDAAERGLSSNDETGLDIIRMYLDEIVHVYPQTTEDVTTNQKPMPESPVSLPKDDFLAGPDQNHLDETLDSLFSDTADASERQTDTGEIFSADEQVPATSAPDIASVELELYGKLSDALEVSLNGEEKIPANHMQGVIEEMISIPIEEDFTMRSAEKETAPELVAPSIVNDGDAEAGASAESAGEKEISGQQPDRRETERRQEDRRQGGDGGAKKVKQSMRVDADKIDYLMNQVGELVVSRAYFAQLFNEIKTLHQDLIERTGLSKNELKPLNEFSFRLGEAGVALGRVSNELQEAVMKVRMLPISQLFKRYPRLVRDLVHRSAKQINLEIRGEETELDKMVIEEISDPLIHIIRNAVDHGIETVEERKHLGKPEVGTLRLEAYHESNHIVIEITDDGRGIDPERIKIKAREKGLYSDEELERMSPLELTRIVMLPGFSTSEKATETSGRGVGMDVVKKNIEKLNGAIDIESTVGRQTRMRIKIPLTLAIIQALMVRVASETFTIPLTTVEETLRIYQHEISEIEGVEVIHIRDTTMPIFRLSKIFRMEKATQKVEEDKFFVVVVSTGMQEVGLVVDKLLGQEEVVIKPLADYLQVESGFSGATIIGDGAISLILDIPELIKMTTEQQISKQRNLAFKRRTAGAGSTWQQTQTIH